MSSPAIPPTGVVREAGPRETLLGDGKPHHPNARVTTGALVLLTASGAALRFMGIGEKSLWIDEAFSLWVSERTPGDLWRTTVGLDFHPPLYYLVLHTWAAAFGDSEVALRSLSALLGVLTLPVAFLIGDRLDGRALGLLSTAVLALSPLHMMYAQQARMYTLMTFFAAVSILSLLHVLGPHYAGHGSAGVRPRDEHARRRSLWWAIFVVSTTLTMLSHNTAVLMPLSVALFVAIVLLRPTLRHPGNEDWPAGAGSRKHPLQGPWGVLIGLVAALALWLPWLPHFWIQSRRVDEEFWITPPTVSTVLGHWHDLVNAHGPEGRTGHYVLLGAALLITFGLRELSGRAVLLLLLLVLVPVAVELLVSLRRPIFYTQTLVWTSVPFSVLLAAGILRLRARPLLLPILGGVVLLTVVAVRNYHDYDGKEDWRGAARYVAAQARPQDLVLFNAAWSQIPFDYYFERSDGPSIVRHGLPEDVAKSGVLEAKMTARDLKRLDDVTVGRDSFWLVSSHDWYTDRQRLVRTHLSTDYAEVESHTFAAIVVTRHQARRK